MPPTPGSAAAVARVGQTEHALDAAKHQVELDKVNIADNMLVARRDGRIEYRIANIGEVLPAGGKLFTMLDVASVYMEIYLPTADAGRVKIGTEGRILLDAYPNFPIAAKVSFIAAQAQFTPKMSGRDQDRARASDVPHQSADRSRPAACTCRGGADRASGGYLSASRS